MEWGAGGLRPRGKRSRTPEPRLEVAAVLLHLRVGNLRNSQLISTDANICHPGDTGPVLHLRHTVRLFEVAVGDF